MCGLSQNLEIYMPILDYTLVRQDSNMINRRGHRRVEVDFWASLKHPLLGLVTGVVQDMSISGVALKLDEDMKFFVMMELDVRLHGEGWDDSMPSLPVQVVRVRQREIALRFLDSCEDIWTPDDDDEVSVILAHGEQPKEAEEIEVVF